MTPEEGYAEALRRIAPAKATEATELILYRLELTSIPAELADCTHLQSLYLSDNRISRIENLPPGLQSLDLSSNPIRRIENLPEGLQSLKLKYNLISQIENLPWGLQLLDLSYSQISRLENLPASLTELDLSYNQISRLEHLPAGLTSLNLWRNQISRLEQLPAGLTKLYLRENQISRLENLPAGLTELNLSFNQISRLEHLPAGLTSLNLWNNQISRLEHLPAGLTWLDLSSNQISRLENLPAGLIELDLSSNQISQLENLPAGLTKLHLWDNQISRLENLLAGLTWLKLAGNPTVNFPPELLGGKNDDDCLETVTAWFAELKRGSIQNQTVRLLITGNGNVGKSSLLDALQNGRCTTKYGSTHAIRIEPLTLPGTQPVQAQVFDFGGQEIYSGTHRLFLRGRVVQLIVFDAQTEVTPEVADRITGETIRNQPLRHWVEQARQQSPQSRFVLVHNKIDERNRADAVTESLLAHYEAESMTLVRVSATEGRGIPGLQAELAEAAHQLPEYGMEMPKSWHNVRQWFLDNLNQSANQRKRLVSGEEFATLCRRNKVTPEADNVLRSYLHQSGTVYADADYLDDTIIADQQWAIKAIYAALDREGDLYERLRNQSYGKCQVRDLFRAFGNDYTDKQRWLFLRFMESCGLCFPLKEEDYRKAEENTYYIFPEFLPTEMPEAVNLFVESSQRVKRVFRQDLPYLPYAHVQQLISRWGLKTKLGHMGRTAFYVSTTKGSFALVADLKQHTLTLHAESTFPDDWVANLLKQFAFEEQGWDEIMVAKAAKAIEMPKPGQDPVDVLAKTQDVVQTMKKVFFSYSHKDETFRDELEVALATLHKHLKLITIWHDRRIVAGEEWNPTIEKELREADIVLMMISADFLNSDFIGVTQIHVSNFFVSLDRVRPVVRKPTQ